MDDIEQDIEALVRGIDMIANRLSSNGEDQEYGDTQAPQYTTTQILNQIGVTAIQLAIILEAGNPAETMVTVDPTPR